MYKNIIFETVYYNDDDTKSDKIHHASICEIIKDLVRRGKYAIRIKNRDDKDIIRIDPFNNTCFTASKDLLQEYNKTVLKEGLWNDFVNNYCGSNGNFISTFCKKFNIDEY